MIGQTISHYQILEKIGEGGMGVVYKAEDTRLHRTVALKFHRQEAVESEELKTRFLHEPEAAAALNHPIYLHRVREKEGPMRYCLSFCIVALALLCACQPATEPTAESSSPAAPAITIGDAQTAVDAYAAAANSGDVETLVSMFADDAMILPADAPAVVGRAAIRSHLTASSQNPFKLSVKVEEVLGGGDISCSRGVFTSTGTPADAEEPITITGKWISISKIHADGSRMIYRHIWNTDEPMPRPTT